MTSLYVAPDIVATAAGDLQGLGSDLTASYTAAAAPTTGLVPMAADEVSAAVTYAFAKHAQEYQALLARAASFHNQFADTLKAGASRYLDTEAASLSALDPQPVRPLPSSGQSVSVPILDLQTPLGPVVLTLTETVSITTGAVSLSGGSLVVPPELALAVDAVGAPLSAWTALNSSGTAFTAAVSSGNLLQAAGVLADAPGSVLHSYLFGQGAITETLAVSEGSGVASLDVSVPYGGLFSPLQEATLTATPSSGSPTVVSLSGSEFGGLVPALQRDGLLPAL
jgi:PE family